MKRKLYFLFLLLIKPARLFRLTWQYRLYKPGFVDRNNQLKYELRKDDNGQPGELI